LQVTHRSQGGRDDAALTDPDATRQSTQRRRECPDPDATAIISDLAGLTDRALDPLSEGLMDLPAIDLSLVVTLPKLIGPDLQRCAN
jgi:hypothetical protein